MKRRGHEVVRYADDILPKLPHITKLTAIGHSGGMESLSRKAVRQNFGCLHVGVNSAYLSPLTTSAILSAWSFIRR
jgi:hypothetical protein